MSPPRREEKKIEEREQAPHGAALSLIDCLSETPWSEEGKERWLEENLAKIEDRVDADRPKDREAAKRAMVRSFAAAERSPPLASEPAISTTAHSDGSERRDLVLRRLKKQVGIDNPSEAQIQAHFEQYSEDLGEYVPPPTGTVDG